ncbi:MAG: acyltransferase [Polyangiaceae bacterium]
MISVTESKWWQRRAELAARMLLRACDQVGPDATITGRPRIVNQGRISIGARFHFSSEPVMSHLLAEHGSLIQIGDDVSIGHGSGIAARCGIQIGNGTRIGPFFLAMDTDYHVPGDPKAAADVSPIVIGAGVHIGNRVTILRGSTIGDGARILDGSVVSGQVSAGASVSGVPARETQSSARGRSYDSVDLRVQHVAQRTFRLPQLPPLSADREGLEAWDSLGMLSLLLALEEEFAVALGEEQMQSVQTLADAVAVISVALDPG